MPSQWRLTMRAASIIGGKRLRVAHQYHFLRNTSALVAGGGGRYSSWKARRMRYARPVLRFAAERVSNWVRWRSDRQVPRVLEPEVAALLQFGAALLFGPANLVDLQARVAAAEAAFAHVGNKVRWLSCEPLIERTASTGS